MKSLFGAAFLMAIAGNLNQSEALILINQEPPPEVTFRVLMNNDPGFNADQLTYATAEAYEEARTLEIIANSADLPRPKPKIYEIKPYQLQEINFSALPQA